MIPGINPDSVWPPTNPSFSQGIVQPDGRVVHVTGQVAWDRDTKVVGVGDIDAQMKQCIANIEAVLAEVGGTLDDVVSLTVYYTDPANLPGIRAARSRHFGEEGRMVSIVIQIAGLVDPDFLVELAPIAVVPAERYRDPG